MAYTSHVMLLTQWNIALTVSTVQLIKLSGLAWSQLD